MKLNDKLYTTNKYIIIFGERDTKLHARVVEYIPLVRFLTQILGPHCEIVLHDLDNKSSSIVAIENGNLSGRRVGDPATNLVLETIHNGSYKTKEFESNYIAKTHNKTFLSSSFFIKDENGEIVGTLCINIDQAPFHDAINLLEQFSCKAESRAEGSGEEAVEQLFGNTREIVLSMVEQTFNRLGIPKECMSVEEKIGIVRELNERGVFQLRGAAGEVSEALGVSEPTVYRYLNKVR